jgi:cytoskeletal protein CcmA (bactofilin family)
VDNQTVVGAQTRIAGEISGEEDLLVEGHVHGRIKLDHTLTVADGGIVEADVDVRTAIVSGVLVGAIHASHSVRLTPSARVVGDITTPRFIVDGGAAFRGRVDMTEAEAPRPGEARPAPLRLARPHPSSLPAISGALERVAITSLLTFLELERRTGVLEVRSERRLSQLALREGSVVNATIDGQPMASCDVVRQYLQWHGGRFAFWVDDDVGDGEAVPTTLLLLEAARRNDELCRGHQTPWIPAAAERSPALAGALEHVGITSVLTLLEMERHVGLLELRSRPHVGQLGLRDGCVVSAQIDASPTPICDAVCELLHWNRGRFVFRVNDVEPADGLAVPTTRLLLEAGRRADRFAAA